MPIKSRHLLPLLLTLVISSCQAQKFTESTDTKTFEEKLRTTPEKVILDVRTPKEYASGHIAGAINIDYEDTSFKSKMARLDKQKIYFIYCEGGGRSKLALTIMKQQGFTRIVELDDGIDDWKKHHFPVTKS